MHKKVKILYYSRRGYWVWWRKL